MPILCLWETLKGWGVKDGVKEGEATLEGQLVLTKRRQRKASGHIGGWYPDSSGSAAVR